MSGLSLSLFRLRLQPLGQVSQSSLRLLPYMTGLHLPPSLSTLLTEAPTVVIVSAGPVQNILGVVFCGVKDPG